MASGTDLSHRMLCPESPVVYLIILEISEILQIFISFHTEWPTCLFIVQFRPFSEKSWVSCRKSCWRKVIFPFMLSEDHSAFRNTGSKILVFAIILEHPLDTAFSNIRKHVIMTNFDTVWIFLLWFLGWHFIVTFPRHMHQMLIGKNLILRFMEYDAHSY